MSNQTSADPILSRQSSNRDNDQQPYQKSKELPPNTNNNHQYGPTNPVPVIVSHPYSHGAPFQPIQNYQPPLFAQAHFYHPHQQQIPLPMTPSSAPPLSQHAHQLTIQKPISQQSPHKITHMTSEPNAQTHTVDSQPLTDEQVSRRSNILNNPSTTEFQTPQRNMPAPRILGSASSVSGSSKKHGTPTGTPESQRKKQRRSDHSTPGDEGDQELKILAQKALDLPIEEFASQVRDQEVRPIIENSGSKKQARSRPNNTNERNKQIFAMTWLLRSCDTSSTAVVPRNRIYARYVGICADNGLKPLSPASFGKLVRILYPNLTTRRLGMRGQSKYHYCGLKLVGDTDSITPITSNGNTPLHNPSFDSSFIPGTPYGSNSPNSLNSQLSTPSLSNLNNNSNGVIMANFTKNHLVLDLKFVSNMAEIIENSSETGKPLSLPDIKPYLPPSTDLDVADTLYGLYKAHCSSIFESLRYMQLKKLFNLLATFHTVLTIPVLKLYSSSQILPWVIASDTVMYREIIKMLAKLALQDIPATVLEQLKQVPETYTDKVASSLASMPTELVLEKLKLAKQFTQLVSRLVRVAETTQTAKKVLSSDLDRELMYKDWIKFVNIDQIASKELPCDGENYKKAVYLLQESIPEFLSKDKSDGDSVIVEWSNYISSLPQEFSDVHPRLFLLCTSAILTSALREISLAGGAGFGAWWVFRCWVDEWIGWCAELGGFIFNSEEESNILFSNTVNTDEHHNETPNDKDEGPEKSDTDTHKQKKSENVRDDDENDDDNESNDKDIKDSDLLDNQFGGYIKEKSERKGESV